MVPVVAGLVVAVCAVGGVVMLMRGVPQANWSIAEPAAVAPQVADGLRAITEPRVSAEPEYASELARMFGKGEVRSVRLIGDSITVGFGTDDQSASGGPGCWADAFREYAMQHGVEDFRNMGVNGEFMRTLAADPDAWIGPGADVIFVALGTNDAGYYGTEQYRADAEAGIAAAAHASKLVVVLSPVCDLRPESMLVEPASELGDVLRDICDEHGYTFVDVRDAVTPDMFNDDDLHPTTEGSLAIWDCICQTLGL